MMRTLLSRRMFSSSSRSSIPVTYYDPKKPHKRISPPEQHREHREHHDPEGPPRRNLYQYYQPLGSQYERYQRDHNYQYGQRDQRNQHGQHRLCHNCPYHGCNQNRYDHDHQEQNEDKTVDWVYIAWSVFGAILLSIASAREDVRTARILADKKEAAAKEEAAIYAKANAESEAIYLDEFSIDEPDNPDEELDDPYARS